MRCLDVLEWIKTLAVFFNILFLSGAFFPVFFTLVFFYFTIFCSFEKLFTKYLHFATLAEHVAFSWACLIKNSISLIDSLLKSRPNAMLKCKMLYSPKDPYYTRKNKDWSPLLLILNFIYWFVLSKSSKNAE